MRLSLGVVLFASVAAVSACGASGAEDDGTAYKLTTVVGEGFTVVLPEGVAPAVAVPNVPIRVNAA